MMKVTSAIASLIAVVGIAACSDGPSAVSARAVRPAAAAFDKSGESGANGIDAVIEALNAAWAAKDAAAYAAPLAEDAQVITPLGTILSGRAAFEARHVFLFAGPLATSTQIASANRVQFLTGTIAIVDGSTILTVGPNVTRALVRWVMEKRDGTWQIVAAQATTIPPGS